ncbi:type II secretion system F family protein [Desulfosporosinus sp. FKA]|uniref:type II secretion system F family protein n=1 Tax=Desulfosporosinus sp. FKA TaxID=1969834 RepID=UPI000B49FB23|nr:type II secretion system F family protein [Desulfosporosinus sp. FKA]
MNLVSIVILGLSIAMLLHYTLFYDYGRAYLAAMYHPGQPQSYRELLTRHWNRGVGWIIRKMGKEDLEKLEKVELTPREYVLLSLGIPALGLIFGLIIGVVLHLKVKLSLSFVVAFVLLGVLAGYLVLRVAIIMVLDTYQTQLKNTLPELINNLKVNIIAGDTIEQAFRSAAEFISGPLEKIVITIMRWSDGETSFAEALDRMIRQTDDTDLHSVLQRIQTYHLSGITDRNNVFDEMAEDMMRISADRQESDLEALEIKLTMLMLGGMIGNTIRLGIPVAELAFKNLLK